MNNTNIIIEFYNTEDERILVLENTSTEKVLIINEDKETIKTYTELNNDSVFDSIVKSFRNLIYFNKQYKEVLLNEIVIDSDNFTYYKNEYPQNLCELLGELILM